MTISGLLLSLFALLAAAMLSAAMIWAIRPMLLRHALATAERAVLAPHPDATGRGHRGDRGNAAGPAASTVWAGAAELKIPLAVFAAVAVHCHGRLCRRRQVHRCAAAAAAAGCRGRRDPASRHPAISGSFRPARSGSNAASCCWPGLWFVNLVNFMDGLDWMTVAEVVPITGSDGAARLARRVSRLGNPCRRGALRRDAGICAVQPPGREGFSRRRRQPADRPAARLVPAATRLPAAIRRRTAAAAVLSARRHRDLAAPAGPARAVLGGPSLAFLSARDRQWLYGMARGRRGVRAQHRAGGAGGRIDHGRVGRDQDRASARRRCRDRAG